MLQNITKDAFSQHLTDGDCFVMDFYADWCPTCQTMLPVVEELAQENVHVPFYKVNVDEFPEIKDHARIKAVPMFVVYKEGKMKAFAYGETDKQKLQQKIKMVSGI